MSVMRRDDIRLDQSRLLEKAHLWTLRMCCLFEVISGHQDTSVVSNPKCVRERARASERASERELERERRDSQQASE